MAKRSTTFVIALSAAIACVAVIRRAMMPKIVDRWEEPTEPRATLWHFKSNGKLELSRWPWWVELNYSVRDNTVCITDPEGASSTYLWRIDGNRLVLSGSEQAVSLYRYVEEKTTEDAFKELGVIYS